MEAGGFDCSSQDGMTRWQWSTRVDQQSLLFAGKGTDRALQQGQLGLGYKLRSNLELLCVQADSLRVTKERLPEPFSFTFETPPPPPRLRCKELRVRLI
jgi:hypothetical protein